MPAGESGLFHKTYKKYFSLMMAMMDSTTIARKMPPTAVREYCSSRFGLFMFSFSQVDPDVSVRSTPAPTGASDQNFLYYFNYIHPKSKRVNQISLDLSLGKSLIMGLSFPEYRLTAVFARGNGNLIGSGPIFQ
jgi:hypothetical protein